MGGGGKSGSSDGELRFPPYLEAAHSDFLTGNSGKNLKAAFNTAWNQNPYEGRDDIVIEDGFLGSGYTIAQFPSLFDMFGKFMAGLDVEVLWSQIYEETVEGPEVQNLIAAQSAELTEDLQQNALPRLEAGMRDICSVNSSAFVVGRALLEAKRLKELTSFSAKVKMQLFVMSQERWAKHLDWNRNVITIYTDMMKIYFAGAMDADQLNYKYRENETLWNLNLFEYVRAMLGALTGTPAAKKIGEASQVSKSLGGVLSGAAAGFGYTGNIAGGVVGGILGLAGSFL